MTKPCSAMRLTAAALGIGLMMAAFGTSAQPPQGAAAGQPRPPLAALPGADPMRNFGAVRRWGTGQPRMTQVQTDDAYLLLIDLNALPPENVQVQPVGRSLFVRTHRDARTRRSETFGDGRGYRESYRVSTGSRTRRLPVPPDGDLAGLTREDSPEQVRILIPRSPMSGWR
ncbi:MAG: Hsp20/alpha crystallin family protein [Lamprobacter sp.]|uniref:Hsp20/alpha crystallin family protein n=1 Tax=Lamprobacter sp. TaxID=3100796 RepID=UPI002B259C4C|nr:Hsp20/alpha crystallin family protein [Lamprobacter sp.]MEA3638982.1 Hsp20/alpha crystallin family protein [Lamprobacter sp.]